MHSVQWGVECIAGDRKGSYWIDSWHRTHLNGGVVDYHPRVSSNFPTDWTDPLDLYGNLLNELVASGHDLEAERKSIRTLIDRYGAQWVWDNRKRIFEMVRSLNDSAGEVG